MGTYWSKLGIYGIQFISGVGVTLFLICSGYGLEVSYSHNGLKSFWRKRFLKVCIPFWMVELLGLLLTEHFTLSTYIKDVFFLQPATSYGWFMQYIIICYIIFFLMKTLSQRFILTQKYEILLLLGFFILWFLVDSLFFANHDMPFLRARQMLSFPCGMLIAKNRDAIESNFSCKAKILEAFVCSTLGILFMAITQLSVIKMLPYVFSNLLSLLTVLLLALAILEINMILPKLFKNKTLLYTGMLSYEIYLIHAFTLEIVKSSVTSILIFIGLTGVLAIMLHTILKGKNNGRFNGCNSYKE